MATKFQRITSHTNPTPAVPFGKAGTLPFAQWQSTDFAQLTLRTDFDPDSYEWDTGGDVLASFKLVARSLNAENCFDFSAGIDFIASIIQSGFYLATLTFTMDAQWLPSTRQQLEVSLGLGEGDHVAAAPSSMSSSTLIFYDRIADDFPITDIIFELVPQSGIYTIVTPGVPEFRLDLSLTQLNAGDVVGVLPSERND